MRNDILVVLLQRSVSRFDLRLAKVTGARLYRHHRSLTTESENFRQRKETNVAIYLGKGQH